MRKLILTVLTAGLFFSTVGMAARYEIDGKPLPPPPMNEPISPTDSKISQQQFKLVTTDRLNQWKQVIDQVSRLAEQAPRGSVHRQKLLKVVQFMKTRYQKAKSGLARLDGVSTSRYRRLQEMILNEIGAMSDHYRHFRTAE